MKEIKIPNHVAIIVDGNGRWAQNKGLARSKGHQAGYKNLKNLSKYILEKDIKVLSLYVFSTENFKRDNEEVDYLMNLFVKGFKNDASYFDKENIKVIFSGRKDNLRTDVLESMNIIENKTKNNTKGILNICLNYGGRLEIIDACNKAIDDVKNGLLDEVNENNFKNYLYQNLPDVDLLIRTGGEIRVSNFLLYQISYAELYFTDIYFPDFNSEDFENALIYYTSKDRRFGGINKKNN